MHRQRRGDIKLSVYLRNERMRRRDKGRKKQSWIQGHLDTVSLFRQRFSGADLQLCQLATVTHLSMDKGTHLSTGLAGFPSLLLIAQSQASASQLMKCSPEVSIPLGRDRIISHWWSSQTTSFRAQGPTVFGKAEQTLSWSLPIHVKEIPANLALLLDVIGFPKLGVHSALDHFDQNRKTTALPGFACKMTFCLVIEYC